MVWNDEFNGTSLDTTKWVIQSGEHAGGKGEREIYTDHADNIRVQGGYLVIAAQKQSFMGHAYTSGRIKTQGHASWTYGKIEARIRNPKGQGLWPAFWLLENAPQGAKSRNYAEIDIMEIVGKHPSRLFGTLHGPGYMSPGIGGTYDLPSGEFADDFHVFGVEWTVDTVRLTIDGKPYKTVTPETAHGRWVFDQPLFAELNLAVGGNWPGDPNAATPFPATMLVDYVRVYQRSK